MENSLKRRRAFFLLSALVFVIMLLFNFLTPMLADDFYFAYAFDTGERLRSLSELIRSLSFHYQEWTGRVVVKFFAQGFTMLPGVVFDFCNAAAYLALGLVIYKLAVGQHSNRYDVLLLALIEIALFEVSPVFGQTNLWMCGACNYLWATLGCLGYLLFWRLRMRAPFDAKPWLSAVMMACGLLAGWLSENTSAGLLVCLVLCMGTVWLREHRLPLWMAAGFAGTAAGFLIMILAPGNYNRADAAPDTRPLLTQAAVRFLQCTDMLKSTAMPLLLAFAALYTLLWIGQRRMPLWPGIFLLGGLASNYAMLLSPVYYERSTHGVLAFLVAACAACLAQIDTGVLRKGLAAITACLTVWCGFHLVEAGYDIASYWMMDRTRTQTIRSEIAVLERPLAETIISYGIEPYTRWCGAYGLPDIRENGEDSLALGRARWYGVGTLIADEIRTYPFPGHTNAAYRAGEFAEQTPDQNESE